MGIKATDFGKLLIEQHVAFKNERSFPESFPIQNETDPKTGTLTPPDDIRGGATPSTDRVGWSVAVYGDLAVAGAPYHDYDGRGKNNVLDAGAVYVYARTSNDKWDFVYKITAEAVGGTNERAVSDYFGYSVDLYENFLAVAAPYQNSGANVDTGAVYLFELSETNYIFRQKLVVQDAQGSHANQLFGFNLTLSKDLLVVGAPNHRLTEVNNNALTNAGAAWVYTRDPETKTWNFIQKVIAQGNERNTGDNFGWSVAAHNNLLAVAAITHDYAVKPGLGYLQDAGAVYVFNWDATNRRWLYETKIVPSNRLANDQFGIQLAVWDETIAVTSYGVGLAGKVNVFRRASLGVWNEEATLSPEPSGSGSTNNAYFGRSLSLHKDTLVAGAPTQSAMQGNGQTYFDSGQVYVFTRTGTTWIRQQTLNITSAMPGKTPGNSILFGQSVSVVDDFLIVGCPGISGQDGAATAGAAFTFTRKDGVWSYQQTIYAWGHDRNANDYFGGNIVINGDTMVVQASGHDYDTNGNNYVQDAGAVYAWTWDGAKWNLQQKITPRFRVTNDGFGTAMALDGDTLAVSSTSHAYDATDSNSLVNAGAVWIFRRNNSIWVEQQKLVASGNNGRKANDQFGVRLALAGNYLAATSLNSYDADGVTLSTGTNSVYVFEYDVASSTWNQVTRLVTPTNRLQGDNFGSSLDIRENTLLIGASGHQYDQDDRRALAAAGAAFLYTRDDQGAWNYVTKFSGWGQDRNQEDRLGFAIAASGTTLAVGTPHHSYDTKGRNYLVQSGAVLIYEWDGSKWNFATKLTSEGNREDYGRFGTSLSMEGDTLVIGAPGEEFVAGLSRSTGNSYGNGAVYVFQRVSGTWTRKQRLLPSGKNAYEDRTSTWLSNQPRFGWSVALRGTQLIVGQPWSNWDHTGEIQTQWTGAAYVFTLDSATNTWQQEARLSGAMFGTNGRVANDRFGFTVDIRDGIAIVGAPLQDYDQTGGNSIADSGVAFVFRRDFNGTNFVWSPEQRLVAGGTSNRSAGDNFGSAIANDGNILVVGTTGQDYDVDGNNYVPDAGAAYIWEYQDTSWRFVKKLSAPSNRGSGDNFGYAVSVSGDTIVVGAPYSSRDGTAYVGSAHVFKKVDGVWGLLQTIDLVGYSTSQSRAHFGASVVVQGNYMAIGAPYHSYDANATNYIQYAGSVQVYRQAGGSWVLDKVITAPIRTTSHYFGTSLDLRDNVLVVGTFYDQREDNDLGPAVSGQGAVWVYVRDTKTWNYVQKLTNLPRDRQSSDNLGSSMAYDDNTLVVSAPTHDYDADGNNYISNAGAVYVWVWENNNWKFERKITPTGVAARTDSEQFGYSLALHNGTLVVSAIGATLDNAGANAMTNAGAIYVYRAVPGTVTRKYKRRAMFTYTGAMQDFVVPANTTKLEVRMWGAGGGNGYNVAYGGPGGFVRASLDVTPGETLQLAVGQAGTGASSTTYAGAGGGRSELMRGSTTLLVAAGGGGGGSYAVSTNSSQNYHGGAGGGLAGIDAYDISALILGGKGGTQTSGGAGGDIASASASYFPGNPGSAKQGGDAFAFTGGTTSNGGWPNGGKASRSSTGNVYVAGGGDGWFGGGAATGSTSNSVFSGGGGGSSYIAPGIVGITIAGKDFRSAETEYLRTLSTATPGFPGNNGMILIEWEETLLTREWNQEARIVPTGLNARASQNQFGYAVAVWNNTVMASSTTHSYDENGNSIASGSGAVWVFERTGDGWIQKQKLIASGVNANTTGSNSFGFSVGLYEDLAVIGAPNQDYDETGGYELTNAGAAYVFRKKDGAWVQTQKLVGPGNVISDSDWFGQGVAADGMYAAIGAPNHDYDYLGTNWVNNAGAIYLWKWDGSAWTMEQKISAPQEYRTNNAYFGYTMAMQGDTLVVGAYATTIKAFTSNGAAFVYRRTGPSDAPWVLEGSLIQPEATMAANGNFGYSVALSGNEVAVGAIGTQGDNLFGSVYMYSRSDGTWSYAQRLVPTGTNSNVAADQYGYSVSLIDNMLVVGAPNQDYDQDGNAFLTNSGAAFVFQKVDGVWQQSQKLVAGGQDRNQSDSFGYSMAVSGDTLVVGATGHDYDADGNNYVAEAGAVYVWVWEGNPKAWRLQQKITPTGTNARNNNDQFGYAVAISGDILVAGAPNHKYNVNGVDAGSARIGAAWVFRRTPGAPGTKVWTQEAKLGITGRLTGDDYFGSALAVDSDTKTIVVGSYNHIYDAADANPVNGAGAVFSYHYENGAWTFTQKVIATGVNRGVEGPNARNASDKFGWSLDVRGNILVVGAYSHNYDQNGRNSKTSSGAAYLYGRTDENSSWVQSRKLVAWGQERGVDDHFGWSVTADGNYMAIGAPEHSYDSNSDFYSVKAGAVYIWRYADGAWAFQQKITARDGDTNFDRQDNDSFGKAVAMNGTWLVVGAPNHGYDEQGNNFVSKAGAAFVFERVNNVWTRRKKLVASGPNGRYAINGFGNAVSIDGDVIVVGEPAGDYDENGGSQLTDAGAVWIFRKDVQNAWNLERRLTPTGAGNRAANYQFGFSVAVKGDLLVVGAPQDSTDTGGADPVTNAGAAYVFRRTNGIWIQEDKIVNGGQIRRAGDNFSNALAYFGNLLVVGAPNHSNDLYGRNYMANAGAVYLFERVGATWSYSRMITPVGTNARNASDRFGTSVAAFDNMFIVGAPNHAYDTTGANSVANSGAVYVFRKNNGLWEQTQKIAPNGNNARGGGDLFGTAMDGSGSTLLVGAPGHGYDALGDNFLTNAGAAWVFEFNSATKLWEQTTKLLATGNNGRNASDSFGSSVSVDDTLMVIGSPNHAYDINGTNALSNSGAAWVFEREGGDAPTASLVGGSPDRPGVLNVVYDADARKITEFLVSDAGDHYRSHPEVDVNPDGPVAKAMMVPVGLENIMVLDGGSGFATPPSVTIVNDPHDTTGSGAVAEAILGGRTVVDAQVSNPGSGYRAVPVAEILGDGYTPATLAVTMNLTGIESVSVSDSGAGYVEIPTVSTTTTSPASLAAVVKVDSVVLKNAGSGYVPNQLITLSGGMGTPATIKVMSVTEAGGIATYALENQGLYSAIPGAFGVGVQATATNETDYGVITDDSTNEADYGNVIDPATNNADYGMLAESAGATFDLTYSVVSVTVAAAGSSYDITQTYSVVFTSTTAPSRKAAGSVTLMPASVKSLTVLGGGSGYDETPSVVFHGDCDVPAEATLVMSPAKVTGFTILNKGSGYTRTPVVEVNGVVAVAELQATTVDHISIIDGTVVSTVGWGNGTKIVATGDDRFANDNFGKNLFVDDAGILVSAPGHILDENGVAPVDGAGALYVYDAVNSTKRQQFVSFDNAGDWADISGVANGVAGTAFTFAAWVKASPVNAGNETMILAATDLNTGNVVHGLGVNSAGTMIYRTAGKADTTSTTNAYSDTWFHVAFVYDRGAGTSTIYVNGTQRTQVVNNTDLDASLLFSLAMQPTSTSTPGNVIPGSNFVGSLSDIAVWNYPLDASNINTVYTSKPSNVRPGNIKGLWVEN